MTRSLRVSPPSAGGYPENQLEITHRHQPDTEEGAYRSAQGRRFEIDGSQSRYGPRCAVSRFAVWWHRPGTQVFVRPDALTPAFRDERFLLFEGGCIDYSFRFTSDASSTLAIEAIEALSLLPRATIVRRVLHDPGLSLCGAGAPSCTG